MVLMDGSVSNGGLTHLLAGMEDVLGPKEVKRILSGIKAVEQPWDLRVRMDNLYGKTGASGLAICSGRAAFKHLLEKQGQGIGFDEVTYSFLPTRLKIRKGLELLARWIENIYGGRATVSDDDKNFHFLVEGNQGEHEPALCDFTVGLLQGFLAWTSGGKFYVVREVECRAFNAARCDFQVSKSALE